MIKISVHTRMCYLSLPYPCVGEGRFEEKKNSRGNWWKSMKKMVKKRWKKYCAIELSSFTFTDVITLKANKGPRRWIRLEWEGKTRTLLLKGNWKKHAGLVRVEPTGARGFYESRDSVPTKSPFFVGFSFWWGGGVINH